LSGVCAFIIQERAEAKAAANVMSLRREAFVRSFNATSPYRLPSEPGKQRAHARGLGTLPSMKESFTKLWVAFYFPDE
jgi:hypothetical protein